MKCRDCINDGVCKVPDVICDRANHCGMFKDKSQYIKLPCKVGDAVYFIKSMFSFMAMPKSEKVRKVEITEDGMTFRTENKAFNPKAINKTVFLTKVEAEKALKKGKENND